MSESLYRAWKMMESNGVSDRYRPRWHISAPVGWINDPNGFCRFNGKYHLFAQFHPYDTKWGPMHWAHWSSDDLVTWSQERVALAPDQAFDAGGCFSGTAVVADQALVLMYTGVTLPDESGKCLQQQCVATSRDGSIFSKATFNPVIPASALPEACSPFDFRDPCIRRGAKGFEAWVASKRGNEGVILHFISKDIFAWKYQNVFLGSLGTMCECPDYFEWNGKKVLLTSIIDERISDPYMRQAAYILVGREGQAAFIPEAEAQLIDEGMDFYAPQTTEMPDGRRVMIGWAQSWADAIPTRQLGLEWSGIMTLPRECSLRKGRLVQQPLRELMCLRGQMDRMDLGFFSGMTALEVFTGACRELLLELAPMTAQAFELRLMQTGNEYFLLTYDFNAQSLTLDRSNCGPSLGDHSRRTSNVPLVDGKLSLHIFIDRSIIEIFCNDGETALTALAFPNGTDYGASLYVKGTAKVLRAEGWLMN